MSELKLNLGLRESLLFPPYSLHGLSHTPTSHGALGILISPSGPTERGRGWGQMWGLLSGGLGLRSRPGGSEGLWYWQEHL